MKRFIVEHKHSGARKPIDGNDFQHACKRWNCDPKIWKLIGEDKQEMKKRRQDLMTMCQSTNTSQQRTIYQKVW
jgi:hypothetical protein